MEHMVDARNTAGYGSIGHASAASPLSQATSFDRLSDALENLRTAVDGNLGVMSQLLNSLGICEPPTSDGPSHLRAPIANRIDGIAEAIHELASTIRYNNGRASAASQQLGS